MKKNLSQVFEELLSRYERAIETVLHKRYLKAKDKEFVAQEIKNEMEMAVELLSADHVKQKMKEEFFTGYKRGEDIEKMLFQIRKNYGEDVVEIRPFKRIDGDKAITLYISEEEKALKKLALDESKLIKYLVHFISYNEVMKRLPIILSNQRHPDINPSKINNVKWTGSKDNKNEFVQLVYALHEAGYK